MSNPTAIPDPVYTNRGTGTFPMVKVTGTFALTPGNLATNGSSETGTVTLKGAAIGDIINYSYGASTTGCTLFAYVSASDTVTWVFTNNTGAAAQPAAGNLYVVAFYNPEGQNAF